VHICEKNMNLILTQAIYQAESIFIKLRVET